MRYKHLFFDLDRTLWDFEANSQLTIKELFAENNLANKLNTSFNDFLNTYKAVNSELWKQYRNGDIDKQYLRENRFYNSIQQYGCSDSILGLKLNDDYVKNCSIKTILIANAVEVLEYLKHKYTLHIITNGFVEAQNVKLENSGIKKYFNEVIISDGLGFPKPDIRIFEYALKLTSAKAEESLIIGDDYEADILGGKNASFDQVYFSNKPKKATYNINKLIQLKEIL